MRLINTLINSNFYISFAAVILTVETQMQLGLKPEWHPYLFIIFFATLFDYNLHRLVTVLTDKEALNDEKHSWVRQHTGRFYFLVFFSIVGFYISVLLAKREVLIALAPIALITIFYSLPFLKKSGSFLRLRQIPFVKIFLIAFVWSTVTIMLPIIRSENNYDTGHVVLMMVERFFFIFAITIPFDIRDMAADQAAGVKTIPLLFGKKRSVMIANIALTLFIGICVFHYGVPGERFIQSACILSGLITIFFINSKRLQLYHFYHYGFLDGAMIIQGLLVYLFYYLQNWVS